MKCKARVEAICWVEFEVDDQMYEKYGQGYLEEQAIEIFDADMASWETTDIELED